MKYLDKRFAVRYTGAPSRSSNLDVIAVMPSQFGWRAMSAKEDAAVHCTGGWSVSRLYSGLPLLQDTCRTETTQCALESFLADMYCFNFPLLLLCCLPPHIHPLVLRQRPTNHLLPTQQLRKRIQPQPRRHSQQEIKNRDPPPA